MSWYGVVARAQRHCNRSGKLATRFGTRTVGEVFQWRCKFGEDCQVMSGEDEEDIKREVPMKCDTVGGVSANTGLRSSWCCILSACEGAREGTIVGDWVLCPALNLLAQMCRSQAKLV